MGPCAPPGSLAEAILWPSPFYPLFLCISLDLTYLLYPSTPPVHVHAQTTLNFVYHNVLQLHD